MTIVDNNILSALAKVERLDLLPAVFDSVGTPPSVVDELDRAKAAGYGFVNRIDAVTAHNGGWLTVVSPAGEELELAEDIRDHALSITDARCLAVAATRDRRLVTDDAHVGTVGRQHDIEVWDLVLLLQAAIRRGSSPHVRNSRRSSTTCRRGTTTGSRPPTNRHCSKPSDLPVTRATRTHRTPAFLQGPQRLQRALWKPVDAR
jgi:predicted nucleic acid-binding protein